MRPIPIFFALPLLLTPLVTADPISPDPLEHAERIVFLGDSITNDGRYIVYLEAALRKEHPNAEFINLGLPSEGVTGLSEPAHPFPRPNVHERLGRALDKANPDVVFACYGMNDGIYHPFDPRRFQQFKDGINKLISAVQAHGATLILLSPPPFDPLPMKKKNRLQPAGAEEFAWNRIYEHYDQEVIAPYAKWIVAQQDRVDLVIDLHGPVSQELDRIRQTDPEFVLSNDGVHIDANGHRLLAEAIHKALYAKPLPTLPAGKVDRIAQQQAILHPAWLSHVGHQRPGVKKGLPLEEARTKAASLSKQ
jgi:lysophospholipase L1-like esterase